MTTQYAQNVIEVIREKSKQIFSFTSLSRVDWSIHKVMAITCNCMYVVAVTHYFVPLLDQTG